ncbi:MAG TPA: ABC transporter permease [Candidatus Saccharicenans sp.]|nr:ABC transporter permease [Candidatus Saccharicenans sp.]HOT68385.1 ABC transporter permease [Candidatus Saccharicenans sp.]HPC88185.1 ABC transporter permease [Candidatus Saccharicenans sp.]HRT25801.1 ABC transporter permease [Candidatus Saccharicenans sp.]
MKVRTQLWLEIFSMSLDSIKTHKMRSFLTALGIVIGVMTVIGMVSVIEGLNASIAGEIERIGSNLIIIQKFEPVMIGERTEEERQRKDLQIEDVEAIKEACPLVKSLTIQLTPDFMKLPEVKYQNIKSDNAIIYGTDESFNSVFAVYLPKEGRDFTEAEIRHSARVCLIGTEVADVLFPHMSPVGKEIKVGREKFTVIGVMSKRGQMFGQSQDNIVAIPYTALMKYFPYDPASLSITIVPREASQINETIEQVTNFLRLRRKVPPNKPNDFAIFTQESLLSLYNQITGAAFIVMIIVSSIGLLVGGIGVMNIMLVAVKERTREIGIRKAIGARSTDIVKQFLIEAVVLTGIGGIIGILAGVVVALIIKLATPLPAAVSWWSAAVGLAVSMAVGLFFGIFPAHKAARLDPIACLRYE